MLTRVGLNVQSYLDSPDKQSFLQNHWPKVAALLFWSVLISSGFWYASANNLTGADLLTQIVELLKMPYGPLIYILVYAIRPITFLSAAALTLAAGSIFGMGGSWNVGLAVFYTVVASHISASFAFLIGRFFGAGVIMESEEQKAGTLQRWANRMRDNTFEAIITMRVLFLPFDLVSYLAGFLRVNWLTFVGSSILGSLAGTIAFISFGASLSIEEIVAGKTPEFHLGVFIFGLMLMTVSIIASRYSRRREARRGA